MAGHFPGARDLIEFWNMLVEGQSQHSVIPAERFSMETAWRQLDPSQSWYGNFLSDYDTFDHKFFKRSPREMASTDPQHRIILQLAYQVM